MYDLWKSVEISIIMQCAHCGTHRRKGIYTLRPYLTKRDLYRRLRTVVVHCTGGRNIGYLALLFEGEWKGSGGYYTQYVPVLEFRYSVRTQGQNHHVSVNCGAS